ncbi:hypothetical protein BJY04DRAFT_224886, partial [Aspergillus karnatakaensis]|uniref:uncharacterized protein n=1 Tax=Aspergillus karnatakaensis TaxID=1810916 RepID=UPI003CCCD412
MRLQALSASLAAITLLAGLTTSTPTPLHLPQGTNNVHTHTQPHTPRAALPVPLRIMPLGDSITWGSLSSTGNGYRGPLSSLLSGSSVDFIGNRRNGNMPDNDNQGHSGSFLAEIQEYALLSTAARPNIVLLHAGTNDMDLNREVAGAVDRLEKIIENVQRECPDAVVLVAKIIFSTDEGMQARTEVYNRGIGEMVALRQEGGQKVMVVDMSGVLGVGDLADKKHPNDSGYAKMANAWFAGIVEAVEKGWVGVPEESEARGVGLGVGGAGGGGGGTCTGSKWVKEGTVADLMRIWSEEGEVAPGVDGASRENVIIADIDGDGLDDYLVVDDDGAVRAWRNNGNIPSTGKERNWIDVGVIATGVGEDGSKVRFADVNGDGLADYLIVYDGGAVKAWLNQGTIVSGQGRKFEEVGTIAAGVGEDGSKVRFGDVNGDGLADYLILYEGGALKAWLNTGSIGGEGRKFEEIGTIATGVSGVSGDKVRLEDFDGDGLVDYLILFDGGAMEGYRNTGNLGKGEGRNFEEIGVIAGGVSGVTGDSVRFGDLNGDGRVDYLSVSDGGAVSAWINTGKAGKSGDGVRFPDLNGDGRADILYLDSNGGAEAWLNAGDGWTSLGEIITGVDGATADNIHFADLDGDQLDDYILVYNGGAAKGWRNNGNLNKGGGPNFDELGTIATGVGAPGDKIRFGDVNGKSTFRDGIADYLVVWDGGAVDAYIGTGNVMNDGRNYNGIGTIAGGVGAPGQKVRFADIDGDGLDDYVVVWDGGAAEAWLNNGNLEKQPELASWDKIGVIAAGVQNQGRVVLADLNGDGKDDYLNVNPGSGAVAAYINQCAANGEGAEAAAGAGVVAGEQAAEEVPEEVLEVVAAAAVEEALVVVVPLAAVGEEEEEEEEAA